MTARTGQQYIADLKDDRKVWLGGRAVSVTEDPSVASSLRGVAGYYDWQHRYAEDCLVEDAVSGEPMSASLIVPRNAADLAKRHRCFDRLARYSYGMLGRTPDYCNTALAGQVARSDVWARAGAERHHENLRSFHREVIEGDLALTHALVHASIDKSVGDLEGVNGELTVKVVRRNSDSIVVRGAKMLATLGPFSDRIFVYPAHPIQPGHEDHVLSFAVPADAKGVIQVCRDHYGQDAPVADAPFSSRFDEQDALVIFEDVEVPHERVFIDGNLDVYNAVAPAVFPGNVLHQTAIRAKAKLEFAYDLLCQIAQVTGAQDKPDVTVLLGEVLCYLTLTRSTIIGAEARAYDWGAGAFFPHPDLGILRCVMPGWMVRVNEIVRMLGSHHLLVTPTQAAFDDPEIGPLLEHYLPGANGISARDRAKIMRTAWDFVGSALGSRGELYERFYLASAARNMTTQHKVAQRTGGWGQVTDFLKQSGVMLG